jgi:membrane protease YdiL (CAAX protease family)
MQTSDQSSQAAAGSRGLLGVMRKHPLFFYFLIAYAFSWIWLTPSVLSAWGLLPGNYTITFAIHTFGPAVAAIIMVNVTEGKAGWLRLRQSIRQWRAGGRWYLFILLGIPLLIVLGIILQPGALASFQGTSVIRFVVTYLVNFVIIWFGGGPLGEEIGWRGFALPRMQPRYGPLGGTLLLGVLWACWHLYEFLMPTQGGGQGTGLATFFTNFSLFLVAVVALAIILTWVFNHTKGSTFIAITAHASVNAPQPAIAPLFLAVNYTGLLLALAIGMGAAAILILVLTRGGLGYRPGQGQSFEPVAPEALAPQ